MVLAFDLLIAVAYFAIPLELLYFFLRFPFPIRAKPAFVGCIFVCFITLCGGTHIFRAFDLHSAVPFITGEHSLPMPFALSVPLTGTLYRRPATDMLSAASPGQGGCVLHHSQQSVLDAMAGACMVISVASAAVLLYLIPGLFLLARTLEKDRAEREALEDLNGTLTESVEMSDNSRGTNMTMLKAVRVCTRRQLHLLTAARSSLKRTFGMKAVDIKLVDGLGPVPATSVVLPVNDIIVVVVDASVHQRQQELLERAALQIATSFRDAGDAPLE